MTNMITLRRVIIVLKVSTWIDFAVFAAAFATAKSFPIVQRFWNPDWLSSLSYIIDTSGLLNVLLGTLLILLSVNVILLAVEKTWRKSQRPE